MADPKPKDPPLLLLRPLEVPQIQHRHVISALPEAWGLVLGGRWGCEVFLRSQAHILNNVTLLELTC